MALCSGVAFSGVTGLGRLQVNAGIFCYYCGLRGVAQPGSASALGAEGREFESHRPDHFYL